VRQEYAGKENIEDYKELLNNLIADFIPNCQIENILIEKIAVDCWRLKRVLRYEMGNIRQFLDMAISDYWEKNARKMSFEKICKTNEEWDCEIDKLRSYIEWNNKYIRALKKGEVKFDGPTWENQEISVEIEEDLLGIVEGLEYSVLTENEHETYETDGFDFNKTKEILSRAGYTDKELTNQIKQNLEQENKKYQKEILLFEQNKRANMFTEEALITKNALPNLDIAERVMRYERSLHKSIMQNILMLKKLQGAW
jgi:hypothetical protein